jgi:hypothetical protein
VQLQGITTDTARQFLGARYGEPPTGDRRWGLRTGTPQARLVILPATSHISISAGVQVLEPMITAFLDDIPPANPSLW